MIEPLFLKVLNMSLTAGIVILAVLFVRIFLRKAPRIFSYALWSVVLFRLLCPFSFSAAFSVLGAFGAPVPDKGQIIYIPEDIGYEIQPAVQLPIEAANDAVNASLPQGNPEASVNPVGVMLAVGSRIWLIGFAGMAIYSLVTLFALKRRLKSAAWERENIYVISGRITPFVLGVFRPKIYLPDMLLEEEKEYILLHERTHIKRGDHIVKIVSFFTLCVHWFNPLVWAAFFASEKDMEMSCDEAVIRKVGEGVKKQYSSSLLKLATGRKATGAVPLAFGEGDTKSRIKNVLRYKKPAAFAGCLAAFLCLAAVIALAANPQNGKEAATENEEEFQTFYGVLKEEKIDDTVWKLVTVPGVGDVVLPEAKEIFPYFETEYFELEPGDLLQINFLKSDEVLLQETRPMRFSSEAQSIWDMHRSLGLEETPDGSCLLSLPLGLLPDGTVNLGDLLTISLQEDGNGKDEVTWASDTPVYAIERGKEVPSFTVNVSAAEAQMILANLDFGIAFSRTQENAEDMAQELPQSRYPITVRTVSKNARTAEGFVRTEGSGVEEEDQTLHFAENCIFRANFSMTGIEYTEISFDEFANLIEDCNPYLNKPCMANFEDGLITSVDLESAYMNYGITGQTVIAPFGDIKQYEDLGENGLEKYYTQDSEETARFTSEGGEKKVEVYTGNAGDGDSGIVLVKDEKDGIIWVEWADESRAGWKNVYLGEDDGKNFLMTVHVEDREDTGEYTYAVFSPDKHMIFVRACSSFEWGNMLEYDDDLFREWTSGMEYYLQRSHLLLSSQDGIIRTQKVSEADKYNYETLRMSPAREFFLKW